MCFYVFCLCFSYSGKIEIDKNNNLKLFFITKREFYDSTAVEFLLSDEHIPGAATQQVNVNYSIQWNRIIGVIVLHRKKSIF